MSEFTAASDSFLGIPSIERRNNLSRFSYQDGYTLAVTDLGSKGVKVELRHRYDTAGAIILPPGQAGKCGKWLLNTLGQDRHGLPSELADILERLSKQKANNGVFKRGDKKKLKDALKVLKDQD